MKKKSASILLLVVLVATLVGAFFVYPNNVIPKLDQIRPWRLGLDLVGGTSLIYQIDLSQIDQGDQEDVVSGLRDVIERRVNLFGVSEPRVTASESGGEHFLNVELAGISDVSQAIEEIGQTPFLEFRELSQEGEEAVYLQTGLNGRYIKGAQLTFDQTTGRPQVAIEFDAEGATLFEEITAKNVGNIVGIFLDGVAISEPVVNERISGGQAVISGNFSIDEARELVQRFNAGALPAPIVLINQQTIGASLGKDSLNASLIAGAVGTGLVALFMVLYYGFFGFLAVLALIVYVVLSLSIFKVFVTMSLAGIAGFLLSIGMAVDANILIFERTKEEVKKGISKISAIHSGFMRAWPSIRDSNIATIITSLILFNFTSSFVKGLALTLLLGVLVSMFTAITVTRGLMTVFVKKPRAQSTKSQTNSNAE